jgi:putative peptide zinc metalloprotease protein
VRLWVLPDASDLPPLVGATHRPGSEMPVVTVKGFLRSGTPRSYPPLTVPPGLPEGPGDPEADGRFERGLRWLGVLVLTAALFFAGLSFRSGPAWAEMPTGQALLTVEKGLVTATFDGEAANLGPGARRHIDQGEVLDVPAGASATLTFPGGGSARVCPGSKIGVGGLHVENGRHRVPVAMLSLQTGRLLAGTGSTSGAFRPLELTVDRGEGRVTNAGAAWFSVETAAVTVSRGKVTVGGAVTAATGAPLSCGDGAPVAAPEESAPEASEEPLPEESESVIPSVAPSTSATPSATVVTPSLTADPTEETEAPAEPTRTVTTAPTTTRPPTTNPPTTRPTSRPPTTLPTQTTTTAPTTPPTPTASESDQPQASQSAADD